MGRDPLTERLPIVFSKKRLQQIDAEREKTGETKSGFIRRIVLEKLDLLGYGEKSRSLEALLQEARRDCETRPC